MSDEGVTHQTPAVFSSKERAALVAKALSEAARRARFSTKRRRSLTTTGFRARRGERVVQLLKLSSLGGLVVVPTIVAALYFGLIASNQYVAEARFTVRGGLPPSMDKLGDMTGAPSMLIVQDTQVIMNYIQSRAAVEALKRSVGLESLYSASSVDMLSRLAPGQPIEEVIRYWKAHTSLKVELPSGIVNFIVKAFTPEDAVKISESSLDLSEQLVNEMNDQMRNDAVALAEKERIRAQQNVAKAHAGLEQARNSEGMLSADVASKSLSELLTDTKGEMIKLQQQYDSQRRFVRADAPQLKNLSAKINAAQREVAKLEDQMTITKNTPKNADGKDSTLAGSMSRLDYANLENTIAEKIYAGSLAALEQAKLASETKLMYINTFVRPIPAEEAKYPKRLLNISLVCGCGFLVWLVVSGLLTLARNRLA